MSTIEQIIILKQDVNEQTIMFEEIANSNLKNRYNFVEANTGEEALQLMINSGSGCLLFSINSKLELQELAILLKKLKKDVKNNLYKISGYNNLKNKKVTKFLADHHITEIFESQLNFKSIEFKFNLWFRSISAAKKKFPNNAQQAIKESNNKASNNLKTNSGTKNNIKELDPLDLHSDCWILPAHRHVKNIMKSWLIEIIGPGPASGHWQDITKKSNSTTPVWEWRPTREDLFTFVLDDGSWIFKGREPFFNWETNLWKFSGSDPELVFYTDRPEHKKFYIENNQLNITTTSEQANAKMQMIKASFDPQYNISADETITDQQEETSSQNKLNMFYKGNSSQSSETLDDKYRSKTKGEHSNDTSGNLSGSGSVEKVSLNNIHKNKNSNLHLQSGTKQQQEDREKEKLEREHELRRQKVENAKAADKKRDAQDEIEGQKSYNSGVGGIDKINSDLQGSGGVQENIERQASRDMQTSHLKTKHSSLNETELSEELDMMKGNLLGDIESSSYDEQQKRLAKKQQQAQQAKQEKAAKKKAKIEKSNKEIEKKAKERHEKKEREKREEQARQDDLSPHFNSLSSILDASVDIGIATADEQLPKNGQNSSSTKASKRQLSTSPLEEPASLPENKKGNNSTQQDEGQFGQHNDSISDNHGDIKNSDKSWEKYYKGGSDQASKKEQDDGWDGPSGNKNSFNQQGSGKSGSNESEEESPEATTKDLQNIQKSADKAEKKKAFDVYMASLQPTSTKKSKPLYDQLGSSDINTNNIQMQLKLKTQSVPGELFDIEKNTELLDLFDNIIVMKNQNLTSYSINTPMLIHCSVYYSNKEFDFTLSGKLLDIEGDEGEILNIELLKYTQEDINNLLTLFAERQKYISNFIATAQGKV